MQPIKRRTRLTSDLINRIIRDNRGKIDGGKGFLIKQGPGGIHIASDPVAMLLQEPAHEVLVVNEGTTTISAFAPAGIVQSVGVEDGDLVTERAIKVRVPEAQDAGRFVITQDEIQPGGTGWAWCGGVCLVRLMRWFDDEILERADVFADEDYVLAGPDGSLDILWSQRVSDAPIVNAEHYAIVRFNGRKFLPWYNNGSVSIPHGGAIVPTSTDTDGIIDGTKRGILNCRQPASADATTLSYVNVGGTVAAGEYGRCSIDVALARTLSSYNVSSLLGAVSSAFTFSASGIGWQVIARLGTFQSVNYAVIRPTGGSSPVVTLQIDRGNTLSDGSTLGIKWSSSPITSIPSLYNPDVDTTFIDGIGRARLSSNGVLSSGFVLVAHYSGNGSPLTLALFANDIVVSTSMVSLPLAGDATQTVNAYVPLTP